MHAWVNEIHPDDGLSDAARAGRAAGEAAPPLTEDQIHQLDVLLNGPVIPDSQTA